MIIEKEKIESLFGPGNRTYKFHKDYGIFFAYVQDSDGENSFVSSFEVGKINNDGEITEVHEFSSATETDFFKAVAKFESLIEQESPQPKPDMPSVGRFFYSKTGVCAIEIDGLPTFSISQEQADKIFIPPMSRPYGQLNTTLLEGEKYEPIKGKYALDFDQEEFKAQNGTWDAVYKMTPYEVSDQDSDGQDTPDGVNDDDSLKASDIEGEDLQGSDDLEPKDGQDGDDGQDGQDGQDGDGDDGDGDGDDGDGDGDDGDGKGDDGDGQDGDGDGQDGDGDDVDADGTKKPGDSDKPAKAGGDDDGDGDGDDIDGTGKTSDDDSDKEPKNLGDLDEDEKYGLIAQLEAMFATDDLKYRFKNQNRLMTSLRAFSKEQLTPLMIASQIPEKTTKKDFLEVVKQNTNSIFTK